jgi:hypothetical protein
MKVDRAFISSAQFSLCCNSFIDFSIVLNVAHTTSYVQNSVKFIALLIKGCHHTVFWNIH